MKLYLKTNVYDAAMERIRWLYNEFPNVICGVSGGKDSTVILHLCLQVARELNRLPVTVMWIDQEAEWQSTVDQVKRMMYQPGVNPRWYQMPFKLFNATSVSDHWLHCWDPGAKDKWIHPQVDISIKENVYGTDRFHELFKAIIDYEYPGEKACYIAGVRTEESPTRFMTLTWPPKYKWVTWANVLNKKLGHYTFYPIYDWSYQDDWKCILDNGLSYSENYDNQYRYGIPVLAMRVSNVHHETAIHDLFYLQEIEPETYERLVDRLEGIDMAAKMGKAQYFPSSLPYMFSHWREYRDYLLKNLITDASWVKRFETMFAYDDATLGEDLGELKYKAHIGSILTNDWEGVKLTNFRHLTKVDRIRKLRRAEAAC